MPKPRWFLLFSTNMGPFPLRMISTLDRRGNCCGSWWYGWWLIDWLLEIDDQAGIINFKYRIWLINHPWLIISGWSLVNRWLGGDDSWENQGCPTNRSPPQDGCGSPAAAVAGFPAWDSSAKPLFAHVWILLDMHMYTIGYKNISNFIYKYI